MVFKQSLACRRGTSWQFFCQNLVNIISRIREKRLFDAPKLRETSKKSMRKKRELERQGGKK